VLISFGTTLVDGELSSNGSGRSPVAGLVNTGSTERKKLTDQLSKYGKVKLYVLN